MATAKSTRIPAVSARVSEAGALVLEFQSGQTLSVHPDSLAPNILAAATLHGLKQKLIDAAAISRDPATGREATPGVKYAAVKDVFDRITGAEPTWNKPREGGAGSGGGLLLQALVRMYAGRKTAEQLREYLAGKTPAEHAALRKMSKIAAIIEEIKAERSAEDGIDGDDLLAELDDGDDGDDGE